MIPFHLFLAALCIVSALSMFAGHAAGYARRGDVERRRAEAARTGGPRYRRASVGASE